MAGARADIIVVSSHVARGAVGNRAMGFALERLGFAVWEVPTVLLPHHPGHGPAERIVPDDAAFGRLLDRLAAHPGLASVGAVLTGYVAAPGQAAAIARLVAAVKAAAPGALHVCDPVIGEASGLYVAKEIAEAVRATLLPLADVATPNAFECGWLSGQPELAGLGDIAALAAAARGLGPATVLVTSAPALMRGHVANLLVTPHATLMAEHRRAETAAKGTGDLIAALFAARLLQGLEPARALEKAAASVCEVAAETARCGADELVLVQAQQALAEPHAPVTIRRLAPGR